MDTLDNTEWDVIISGTGLKQSLLALALSRSCKKTLHIDPNAYYGGTEAALSLSEAESWVQHHSGETEKVFSHAALTTGDDVGSSRSYSLALAPQLVFSRSNVLSALVSSGSHGQLEFQAVGSWFVLDPDATQSEETSGRIAGLQTVPGSREEVFQDAKLDLRTKRALMKFIRQSSLGPTSSQTDDTPLPAYLETQGIPASAHASITALTLSPDAPEETSVTAAVPNITRYLQSIGHLGPGFAAVTPKYGGLAEIAQVACRACAVGGGVYVLSRGIDDGSISQDGTGLALSLGGERVKTQWLVRGAEELSPMSAGTSWSRGIYIVKSTLTELFPITSEGGVTPAGAVIMVPKLGQPPVYLFVHSSDTGECSAGKCIIYANVKLPAETGFDRLQRAVRRLGEPCWGMQFQHNTFEQAASLPEHNLSFDSAGFSLALEDSMLDEVKHVWEQITQAESDTFMKFDARNDEIDNE